MCVGILKSEDVSLNLWSESVNILCIFRARIISDIILESGRKTKLLFVWTRTIWSKMEHLILNGPNWKNQYFQNLMLEMDHICSPKMGTIIFLKNFLVILVPHAKFLETNRWNFEIFYTASFVVPISKNFQL